MNPKYLLLLSLVIVSCVHCEDLTNKLFNNYITAFNSLPQLTDEEAAKWSVSTNEDYLNHPCRRTCVANQSMSCYYYMVMHYDETMSSSCDRYLDPKYRYKIGNEEYININQIRKGVTFDNCKYGDGVKSEIMVINSRLPGSIIEVCKGDTIIADIVNSLHESSSMHWHGMHQRNSPHMDGVPHITQYPIEAGQAFRYNFEADHAGTHWWHSHTEHQRAFGLAGALIVRQPVKENVHAKMYSFDLTEHTIMLQDWVYDFDESIPVNILINGLGKNTKNLKKGQPKRPTLYESFTVKRGGRYRFRVIFNGVANCPITLSIDEHDLVVIASDGNDIEPVTVQKLTFTGGERFDFVLHANQRVANYFIRIKGDNFCKINKLHQEAILNYYGANPKTKPIGEPASYTFNTNGIELNPIQMSPNETGNYINMVELNSLELEREVVSIPSNTFYSAMKVTIRDGFLFQMDDITFTLPRVSLLQTRNLGTGRFFCNKTQQVQLGMNCRNRHCQCTNVINVPAYKTVEFVYSSASDTAHPIHIHGYTFRVVGMGFLGEDKIDKIEEIDRKTPLQRRTRGAPLKDTVLVPAFGYTIVRFYTDNPGYWIVHCHISTHSEKGMSAVLRVGENLEMRMCPLSNCGLCKSVL